MYDKARSAVREALIVLNDPSINSEFYKIQEAGFDLERCYKMFADQQAIGHRSIGNAFNDNIN